MGLEASKFRLKVGIVFSDFVKKGMENVTVMLVADSLSVDQVDAPRKRQSHW